VSFQLSIDTLNLNLVSEKSAQDLTQFHHDNWTSHLFPRDFKFFDDLIKKNKVYELREELSKRIVGVCYVDDAKEQCNAFDRREFGGLFVIKEYQGTGVAQALCSVALIHSFAFDQTQGRLISHIHENNKKPLKLFTKSLHFLKIGFEIVPYHIARKLKMDMGKKGLLVGNLYTFKFINFKKLSAWLNDFNHKNFELKSQHRHIKIKSELLALVDVQNSIDSLIELSKKTGNDDHVCKKCANIKRLDLMIVNSWIVRFLYKPASITQGFVKFLINFSQ